MARVLDNMGFISAEMELPRTRLRRGRRGALVDEEEERELRWRRGAEG